MNGGASGRPHRKAFIHYDRTISSHRWVRHALLPSRENARCTQRDFSEATAEECDEPEQHGMNGDCIAEENCK